MASLSKSRLLAFRQCPRRLWLETHQPSLRQDSGAAKARFKVGNEIGDIARRHYDPDGTGALIEPFVEGFAAALRRTSSLLTEPRPIFEAGFDAAGGLAFADILLPVTSSGKLAWRMIEVKSSSGVKDYHLDDAAVQACVARAAGVALTSVSIAHIDSSWVYAGNSDYSGLLVEQDVTGQAFERDGDVRHWLADAAQVVAQKAEPQKRTGGHCKVPNACGFMQHCQASEPVVRSPVRWLPRIQATELKNFLEEHDVIELDDVPDDLLNAQQLRVKHHTLSGETYFDREGAAADLTPRQVPCYFLDFETIQFAMPIWAGTRPYEQIPFQCSVHVLTATGALEHDGFLALDGANPLRPFAEALLQKCGTSGPVFVYNAGFEKARIREVAARFADLAAALLAINARIVDLLPVARNRYYHPSQEGSWSIKRVLPAIAPDLSYAALDGVQDGGMAMEAFQEAIAPSTTNKQRQRIAQQLQAYCRMDTFAMVRLWLFFTGQPVNTVASHTPFKPSDDVGIPHETNQ